MPKMKTHRASAKRFRPTKSGRFKRGCAYKTHIMTKFTTKRVRQLRKTRYVSPQNQKQIERLLPYAV